MRTPEQRPSRPRVHAAVAGVISALLVWVACGGTPGGNPADRDLPGLDSPDRPEAEVSPDPGRDDGDEAAFPLDAPEVGRDAEFRDPGDTAPGKDSEAPQDGEARDVEWQDPGREDVPAGEEAPPTDAARCMPDEDPCPCQEDEDCPEGTFCAGDRCRPWVCWPGATTCLESNRILCDRNGGGYQVLEDCDDHNACTLGDGCAAGGCLPRSAVSCDDDNPCTVDRCEPTTGECRFEPMDDLPCDDGDPCTTGDRCQQGACVPRGSRFCGDGNPCTDDLCTSLLGCVHLPREGPCTPGASTPCTVGGSCRDGRCDPVPRDCDDQDVCTEDSCDPASGTCRHLPIPGCACVSDRDCDDEDPCTDDPCQNGACSHVPKTGLPCCLDDRDCPVEDPCLEALCQERRCTQRPRTTPECCQNPDRRWDFEAGPGDWTPVPDDQAALRWRWMAAPGGGGALGFGREDGAPFDVQTPVTGEVRSVPLAIPGGVQTRIRWRVWLDLDDAPGRDLVRLEAIRGEQVVGIWERPAGFPMRLWQWLQADLSVLGGSTIALRLVYDSLGSFPGSGRQVFVDDLSVQSSCVAAPCAVPGDCISLGRIGECQDATCRFQQTLQALQVLGDQDLAPPLTTPSDVLWSPEEGRLFLSDRDRNQVRVLDPAGREIESIGGAGQDPGQFLAPRGLAWSRGLLWVADSQNHRVQALTPSGVPVLVLGHKGSGTGEFLDPRDVALSEDGERVFVADTGNHRVQALTRWGVPRFAVGSYGTSSGRFRSPSCVVVLPGERLLVCDSQNNRLQVLGPDGAFLQVLRPLEGAALSLPYHAAAFPDGSVVVSDSQNHRVVHMTLEGRVLWSIGAFGSGAEEFQFPMGLAALASGEVWVVDSGNRRLVLLGYGPWP